MPIEIDASSNLYITSDGDGDRDTFAGVFREVWQTIPACYRESMVREWRKGIVGQASSPVINLVRGHRYAGENVAFGHTLFFNSDVARLAQQENRLRDLIAHELGHVWHYPIRGAHVANPRSTWSQKECEADRLAVHWGFDMTGLRLWADAHGSQIAEMTGVPHVSWKLDCAQEWSSPPLWQ